jgi:hypothetical protein
MASLLRLVSLNGASDGQGIDLALAYTNVADLRITIHNCIFEHGHGHTRGIRHAYMMGSVSLLASRTTSDHISPWNIRTNVTISNTSFRNVRVVGRAAAGIVFVSPSACRDEMGILHSLTFRILKW